MSKAQTFNCPSCGASLIAPPGATQIKCSYCDETVIVPEELRPAPAPPPAPPYPYPAPVRPERAAAERRGSGGCALAPLAFLFLIGVIAVALMSRGTKASPVAAALRSATATPVPINVALEGTLPRQVHYASLQFTVSKARISNQVPARSGQPPRYVSDQAYAYIDVTVNNPLATKSVVVGTADMPIGLQTGDGQLHKDESGWIQAIDAQSTQEAHLVFRLPVGAAWKGSKLIVGQPEKELAVLPLDGAAPQAAYPVSLPATGQATAQRATYKILSAALDLDSEGERADAGKRFLKFSMRVTNDDPGPASMALVPSDFRLIVNGNSLAPTTAPIQVLAPNSTAEGEVVFVVPAGASTAELQVGDVSHEGLAKIPVALPATKP